MRVLVALGVVGVLIAPIIWQRIEFTSAELDAGSFFDSTFSTDGIAYNADVLSEGIPTYPTLINLPGTEKFERNIIAGSGEGNLSFPGVLLITLGLGGLVALHRRGTLPNSDCDRLPVDRDAGSCRRCLRPVDRESARH